MTASEAIREALLLQSLFKTPIDFPLSIYPNPTSGRLYVNLGQSMEKVDFQLSNAQGQIIQSWSFNSIDHVVLDISNAKGLYYLNVTSKMIQKTLLIVHK